MIHRRRRKILEKQKLEKAEGATGMSTSKQSFNTELFRVFLTAGLNGEMTIEVVTIPARQGAKVFDTAHGKRIKVESLACLECVASSTGLLCWVYVQAPEDVDAAITLAWEAARKKTAQTLADAQACFTAAHSKPAITRSAWVAE
jgi:hypothetical protein